jgi:rfaE bifunctional protein nucleotidyltransferase chain/domain
MLVVLLNTDDSISRIKGHLPYFDQYHRCKVIESIRWVDYVVMFDEDTPINLLSCIRPNVHVKGGDYVRDELPETPLIEICGGRVDIFNSTGADTRYRSSSIAKRIIRESKLNLEAHRFRASLRSDLPIDKDQLHAFDQILKEVGY